MRKKTKNPTEILRKKVGRIGKVQNLNMKKLTLNNFTPIITWREIEERLGKRDFKKFQKFMKGQTCAAEGVYQGDLAIFLQYEYQGKKTPEYLWD